MVPTSRAHEDYLEAIYMLSKKDTSPKSVDIATFLNVSKAAVSKAFKELQGLGYLKDGKYQVPELTESGLKIAKTVYSRHKLLKEFLVSLGVSPEVAEIDGCKMEHILSKETLDAIKEKLKTK